MKWLKSRRLNNWKNKLIENQMNFKEIMKKGLGKVSMRNNWLKSIMKN